MINRPLFITVLCVLAWVNFAIQFILGLGSLFSMNSVDVSMEILRHYEVDIELYRDLSRYVENIKVYGFVVYFTYIICAVLASLGVYYMWYLKRIGFFIFSFFAIIPPVLSLYVHSDSAELVFLIITVNAVMISAFIILFATQLGSLKSVKSREDEV